MVGTNEFVKIKIKELYETSSWIHEEICEKFGKIFFKCIILSKKNNDATGISTSVT